MIFALNFLRNHKVNVAIDSCKKVKSIKTIDHLLIFDSKSLKMNFSMNIIVISKFQALKIT